MNPILIKVFATALALSQVTTRPEAIKTRFDPVADRAEVVELLRAGCAHMRKVFDIEELNLDELIATAMDDPKALTGDIKAFRGINFADLHTAYREFCKNEKVDNSPVDLGEVVAFYNKAVADLPDHARLKGLMLPGASVLFDQKGERFAELFEPDQRRIPVPLSDIPEPVQKAFVAAEDKRFFTHKGIDERGLIRAFIGNLAQPTRPQGGSTITQQVAKNLAVGDDVTYERKIREMIVASRIERTLTKGEILELYLNSIYLGRGSWGIEMAARSYFAKPAKALTVTEGAYLAGLTKGPNYFSPDRHPERAQERLAYVLNRMQEDGAISADEKQARSKNPCRARVAHCRLLHGALHHRRKPAAGNRGGPAGRLGALRKRERPRPVRRRRGELERGDPTDRGGAGDRAGQVAGMAEGARKRPPAALRRALDDRRRDRQGSRGNSGRPAGRARPAAAGRESVDRSRAEAL